MAMEKETKLHVIQWKGILQRSSLCAVCQCRLATSRFPAEEAALHFVLWSEDNFHKRITSQARQHIGCDGASYKCTQWHFLIRISKNKCNSSNSAKKGDPESNPLYHLHGKCSIQKQPSLLSSLYWYLLTMYPMPWREMPAHWKGCGCPTVEDSRRW